MADERTAERSHQIAECKYSECGKELGDPILMGEELLADRRGKKAVDSKIVPFEHVADQARDDHPIRLSKIHFHVPKRSKRASKHRIVCVGRPNQAIGGA